MADEEQRFSDMVPQKRTVKIRGQEYALRELSLAEKIQVAGPVVEYVGDMLRNVLIRRNDDGVRVEIPETLSLADLKVEKILLSSVSAMSDILKLSVPDFTDWDSLGESETREPLAAAMAINDFCGFATNFISWAAGAIRSLKQS